MENQPEETEQSAESTVVSETENTSSFTLKVKLVGDNARLPERANPTDAGADLFAPHELIIGARDSKFMDFGVQVEVPDGMAGYIFARSGLGSKHGIRPRNCVGVIDSKYRGNLCMMVENNSDSTYHIHSGDRVAQLVIMPVYLLDIVQADELDMTEERGGGLGHTGK